MNRYVSHCQLPLLLFMFVVREDEEDFGTAEDEENFVGMEVDDVGNEVDDEDEDDKVLDDDGKGRMVFFSSSSSSSG